MRFVSQPGDQPPVTAPADPGAAAGISARAYPAGARCPAGAGSLVVLGRNNPSLYTVNGRPLYVHLNGLAIVLLK